MTAPGAPLRDRQTWLLYGCLAVYGYVLYGLGPSLDALRESLGVSRSAIGLTGSMLAVGGVVTALTGRALVARVAPLVLLRASLAGIAAGVALLATAVHIAMPLAAGLLAGLGGGVLLVVIPVVVEDRQPQARPAVLAEANFGAAAAGVVAPLAVGAATLVAGGGWRVAMALALVPLAVLAAVAPRAPLGAAPPGTQAARGVRLPRGYWRWWTALAMGVATEFSVLFWATDLLQQQAGMRRGAASAAFGLFVAGMAAGRLLGGRLAVAGDPVRLLAGAVTVAIAGLGLLWWSPAAAVAVAGLFIAGCGVSLLYPLSLSLAIGAAPGRVGAASARASLASGVAVLGAPFGLAALADAVGIQPAFAVVFAFTGTLLVLALSARRR